MNPNAPAATPLTSNSNQPYGGFGQAQTDYSSAAGLLANLPTQEAQTTANATANNRNPGSILPNINITTPTYAAPTITPIDASKYGSNLTGYNQAVQAAEQRLTGQENTEFGSAVGALNTAEQQYGNLTPVYQSLATSYNIPGYQQDVASLTGLLQNLNRDVNAQTTLGGGLMTESARDEAYANQAQPLNLALSNASQFLQAGQADVSNLLDAYEKSLANELTPLQTQIGALPGLFGQTNQAAQAGYEQGATSIENMISNQQRQQEIANAQAQTELQRRQVNAEFGAGNLASVLQSGSTGGGQFGGVTRANNGYQFNVGGRPATAASWAAANGQNPATVVAYMAQNGDPQAQRANQLLTSNPNISIQQLAQQFPELFGGLPGSPAAAPTRPAPAASNPFAAFNPFNINNWVAGFQGRG